MNLGVSQILPHIGKQYRYFLWFPAQELRVESQRESL